MTDPKEELMRRAEERRRIAEQLESQAQALEQAASDLADNELVNDDQPVKRIGGRR